MSASTTALLITGNEEFLRARVTTEFLDRLRATGEDLSMRTAEAEELNGPTVQDLLSPELFGGIPVVVINNGNKLSKDALAAVANAAHDPDCAVIVDIPKPADAGGKAVITALTKAGFNHENVVPPKNAKDKRAYAQNELRRAGVRADGEAINALVEGEPDLRGIAMRARQLADDHKDGQAQPQVTTDDVIAVVTSATVTGFVVSDALIARNPRAIAAATRAALDAGAAPLLIQASCLMALRDIAAIRSGNTHKMPPWKAQKLSRSASQWDAKKLASAIHEMGVIGETVRSSSRSENALLAALLRAAA
jgi:DNA polymerase-3 subunit delta